MDEIKETKTTPPSSQIAAVRCLFEQSGTFKNQFIALGIPAYDYDIENDFDETDFVVDLFEEIDLAYEDKPSIFDEFSKDDLIFAFPPCIRFSNQIMINFRGQQYGQRNWTMDHKMVYDMKLIDELAAMYKVVNKLCIICYKRGFKLVMENPFSEEHFLRRYWCLSPSIIDKDRRRDGDYYPKPTQYWFVNFEPKNNLLMEEAHDNAIKVKDVNRFMNKEDYCVTGAKNKKVARSMIHPEYANRFIRKYIVDN